MYSTFTKLVGWIGILCLLTGCVSRPGLFDSTEDDLAGGQTVLMAQLAKLPTVRRITAWPLPDYMTGEGLTIETAHYRIHTTAEDILILRQLSFFLESAFNAYQEIGVDAGPGDLLVVYFFQDRQQWEVFTRRWTGRQAGEYLNIKAGAYYYHGACVAYHLGRGANLAVLAHEGWHQFSDACFTYRLPAWLDEGLATSFEGFRWEDGRVDFDVRLNAGRLMALQQCLAEDKWYRLEDLLRLDAGRVVSHAAGQAQLQGASQTVGSYYAQLYALARFLREDAFGRRRAAFERMLVDGREGRWPLEGELREEAMARDTAPSRRWNAQVGPMLFEYYFQQTPGQMEAEYRRFCAGVLKSVRFQRRP
ncbi:MAG: hypothetical protein JW709_13245 [Sedimentisphaerales bacterium]|nr:hypothetical protein [Sedimentisphaerales bacterium]